MPGLERIDARRLLDLGEWRDTAAGARLTEAGTVNENVYYLLRGEAAVHSGSTLIARLDAHTFVGDMGLVSGGPASATVTVVEPARVLVLPVAPLKRLMERNAEVRRHLRAALTGHLVGKLVGTSRDLADSRQAAPG